MGEEDMRSQENKVALDQHWAASAAGDLEKEHNIYSDDVLCEYPQSGERIHGRRNLRALREHHPEKPSGFRVRRMCWEQAISGLLNMRSTTRGDSFRLSASWSCETVKSSMKLNISRSLLKRPPGAHDG